MATITRTEKRQKGIFGWIFAILFWAFNALMLLWVIAGANATSDHMDTLTSDVERAGAAIGTVAGIGMIITIWVMGAIILGLLMWASRGKKIIVETQEG